MRSGTNKWPHIYETAMTLCMGPLPYGALKQSSPTFSGTDVLTERYQTRSRGIHSYFDDTQTEEGVPPTAKRRHTRLWLLHGWSNLILRGKLVQSFANATLSRVLRTPRVEVVIWGKEGHT